MRFYQGRGVPPHTPKSEAPATDVERDPQFTPDFEAALVHQNLLVLLALQVLFGLGVWTGWKLYTHPMTTSERRVPDRVPDAEAMALGGGDIPAPVPGFFDKFFVTRVHADPAAADPHGATEAANLQVCFPPPPIETDL